MLLSFKRGQGSVVIQVFIRDSAQTDGRGKTGLAYNTSGLIISTRASNEASTTNYTVASSNIEDITTLGTFAAPTSGKCRFKQVDSTNQPGIYEIQIADARFAVSSAKSLTVFVSGATGCVHTPALIPLVDLDPYDPIPDVRLADGVAHGGTNTSLELQKSDGDRPLYIHTSSGTAATIVSTDTGSAGGMTIEGAGAYGLNIQSNNYDGLVINGDLAGVRITGGTDGDIVLNGTGLFIGLMTNFASYYGTVSSSADDTHVTFSDSSTEDDLYNEQILFVYDGTGKGQTRKISDYDGGTKTVTLFSALEVSVDNTSKVIIIGYAGE